MRSYARGMNLCLSWPFCSVITRFVSMRDSGFLIKSLNYTLILCDYIILLFDTENALIIIENVEADWEIIISKAISSSCCKLRKRFQHFLNIRVVAEAQEKFSVIRNASTQRWPLLMKNLWAFNKLFAPGSDWCITINIGQPKLKSFYCSFWIWFIFVQCIHYAYAHDFQIQNVLFNGSEF